MTKTKTIIEKIESCYDILIGNKFDNFIITNIDTNAQITNGIIFNFNKLFITLLNVKTNKLSTHYCYIDNNDRFIQFCINEDKNCLYDLRTSEFMPNKTIFKQFVFDIDNKQFFMLDSKIFIC